MLGPQQRRCQKALEEPCRTLARRSPGPRFFTALFLTALGACSEDALPTSPRGLPPVTTQFVAAAVDSQARTGRDPEAIPTRMALAVSGFAGFGFDTANGDLVIWLKDQGAAQQARAVVAQYLATQQGLGGKAGRNPPVKVRAANFDFLELGSLRDQVTAALAAEPGLRWVGISLFANRVEIGADAPAADRVAEALRAAGIPDGARQIVTVQPDVVVDNPELDYPDPEPVAAASGAPLTLASRMTQIAGGLQMTTLVPGGAFLVEASGSAGAVVKDSTGAFKLLTVAHFSPQTAHVDGNGYYQPHINNYDKTKTVNEVPFAFESTDPGWKSALPSWIAYKWADANLSTWLSQQQTPDFGHIYRPKTRTGVWTTPPVSPKFEIDPVTPKFNIVGVGIPAVGQLLDQVGFKSGWTFGLVEDPCQDINYPVPAGAPKPTFRCQVRTSIPAHGGDSGGPVFRRLDPNNSNVEFMGIHTSSVQSINKSYFAPWGGIKKELGTLTVFP